MTRCSMQYERLKQMREGMEKVFDDIYGYPQNDGPPPNHESYYTHKYRHTLKHAHQPNNIPTYTLANNSGPSPKEKNANSTGAFAAGWCIDGNFQHWYLSDSKRL